MVKRLCALLVVMFLAAGCAGSSSEVRVQASSEPSLDVSQAGQSPIPDATSKAGLGSLARSDVFKDLDEAEPLTELDLLDFKPCGRPYMCAELEVPVDHNNLEAGSITLELGMLPATDEDRRIGVLLVNPGGPGSGMEDFLDYGAGLSPDVLEQFDVVGWNPRGVTADLRADCSDEAEDLQFIGALSDTVENEAKITEVAKQAAEACLESLDGREHLISTLQTVHDMDWIRQGLGEDQISYFGYSYGTTLGQFYADLYGTNVRAVVLDGVVDVSLSPEEVLVEQIKGFARVEDEIFAACLQDVRCPVVANPKGAYLQLMKRLEDEPLLNTAGEVVAGTGHAATALAAVSYYSSEVWGIFYEAFAEALAGNGMPLAELAWFYTRDGGGLGAFYSISCTDSARLSAADVASLVDQMTALAGALGRAAAAEAHMCVHWPETEPRPHRSLSASEAPPILVIGNRGDNATPYEWAVAVAEALATGVLVTYNGQGHTSYGSSTCVDEIVDEYLINLTVPPDGTECG